MSSDAYLMWQRLKETWEDIVKENEEMLQGIPTAILINKQLIKYAEEQLKKLPKVIEVGTIKLTKTKLPGSKLK